MAGPFETRLLELIKRRNGGGESAEDLLQKTSAGLIKQTDPLRRNLINRSNTFLGGNFDITQIPEYGFMRDMIGRNADMAKDNILETMPSGGTLLDKLADVDIGKMQTMTALGSDLYGRELDRATSLATGAPLSAGMSGLGSILQLLAAREGAAAQRDAGQQAMLGAGLGGLLGGIDW